MTTLPEFSIFNKKKYMCLSQREEAILSIIRDDIKSSGRPFSTLTNDEISRMLNISFTASRDKIHQLVKKGYLQRVINYWTEDGQFHNRVLYKGILTK